MYSGVGIFWLICLRYFGSFVALIAGLAYAISPWAVLYSRKIWAQDFHTPFILLGLLLGMYGFWEAARRNEGLKHKYIYNRHDLAQTLSLPILLFGMQIHFAAWALLPIYGILLWKGRHRISGRALIVSLLLSAFVLLPYAIGLSQTLDHDPTRISDAASRSEAQDGLEFSAESVIQTVYLTTGLGMETWLAPDQQSDFLAQNPPPNLLWLLLLPMLVLGIFNLWRNWRTFSILILIWAFLPPVLLVPSFTPVFPHYFIASIPALLLLIGLGIHWLYTKIEAQKILRVGLFGVFGLILLSQILWWHGVLRFLDNTAIAYPGFTTPIHYLNDLRSELQQYNDVVIISHGMDWLFHHEAAVWQVMLNENAQCVRTLQGDGYAVLPEHPFAVVVAPDAPENPIQNLYPTTAAAHFPTRPDDGNYSVYTFDTTPQWRGAQIEAIQPVAFEIGVQLTGYALSENQLILQWRLPAQNKDLIYQYSGQLLDENGERLSQQDTVFWQGRHWCEGDTLITWTDLDKPSAATTLRVSLYTLGTGRNAGQYFSANIIDALGNPTGQWLDIPLNPER